MSNPYRARPARSRVDHSLGYGVRNQNMWAPMTRPQSEVPPNDTIQNQAPIVNQSKQTNDPWNNSWNWDIGKQTETQQQQQPLQPQQQPQHYVPSYSNQGQLISNSVQDHYYQNANGNKSDVLNQNSVSGRNTPAAVPGRPPTSNHSDSFTPYSNYIQNQQYPQPPRPSSVKNNTMNYDHPQWTNEQQLQNVPYPQQRAIQQNQKDQGMHPPLVTSNYNWNKPDHPSVMPQRNWQNANVQDDSQDVGLEKEVQHLDDMGNQCVPPTQHNPPSILAASSESINKEHSKKWSNVKQGTNDANNWPNQGNIGAQWQNQNRETKPQSQVQQPAQIFNADNELNSWSQPPSMDAPQQWKQTNCDVNTNQWVQEQKGESNFSEESKSQDGSSVASNDWQLNRTHPSNYSLPHVPPISEPSTESNDRKHSAPSLTINSSSLKEIPAHPKAAGKPQFPDPYHKIPVSTEAMPTHGVPEHIPGQDSKDFDITPKLTEWARNDSVEELPSKLDQLDLGTKLNKPLENPHEPLEVQPAPSGDTWSQETVPLFGTDNSRSNNGPDNIPILPTDYVPSSIDHSHSAEIQSIGTQELATGNTYQMANIKVPDMSQSGYDQWYNQNAVPVSSESAWYSKDHSWPAKQWTAEQNVENYENIQQPSEFVNLEVVAPSLQERDIYGSRDSINKETLDNDPKPVSSVKEVVNVRDFKQEVNNVEVPSVQQSRSHPPLQQEQVPDNYEFASNDRNTFLETGELTDSHQEHESTPPSQDDENDEVPNDIPFLREVPGQSSSVDPRRNDPTGQEQYVQAGQRLPDPRRNDPSGQEQSLQLRAMSERSERRDVPPGQERSGPILSRSDSDTLERRNDPSGRERSLPPQQSRNDPSGEERYQSQPQLMMESSETREIPGRGNESEEPPQLVDENLRQIPGGASPNEDIQSSDDRTNGRVVTGSREVSSASVIMQDPSNDSRSKREEAVGASVGESQGVSGSTNRRDSYEDEDEQGSGNSRDESRERRRDSSPDRRRYEYDRKSAYYDRDREYDDDYYYDRRRADTDRSYNPRDDFERRDVPYRDDERKHHSRDDLDRHSREELERRNRSKDDLDERDGRRRPDDRRRDRGDDLRRREVREYDSRYTRDRDYNDRERRRDDRRPRRYDDYDARDPYRRDLYDESYGRSSRPSSRSSYNDRDRDYYMRTRDPYYGYNGYTGYEYGTQYGNSYYTYLENLRRTNPAAYSEWYHKYYASQHQQQHMARGVANYPEDRASVHSGRSSCDERTTGEKRTIGDMSLLEDSTTALARMTPTKFSTSHAYGCFSIGSLIHVHPSYPADGERAKVDVFRVDNLLLHDPVARDLRAYPGPLIKGVTHKKTIIEYCENKIKKAAVNEDMADRASYILLYELMIMLIQQNGNVVGVDIAALLLRNKDAYPYDSIKQKLQDTGRRESVISQRSGATGGETNNQDVPPAPEKIENNKTRKSIEQITDEFRNTLLYGLVQEALEYAMNEGLWGHALFLASKLDKRTHASVMTRFANSLPHHDPLQTLYQLHSGRVPAVVTCVADPRWDDWRPHLAMIISNTSANPEVNRRSITTLGDTLSARGDIHAAHFCYILAQVDFGAYGTTGVKLVLIGTNHNKSYAEFLNTEAVMLTEIYEYARNLSEPGFTLVDLQTFKFDLAVKMVDYGLIEKALLYIEQIALNIANEPSKYKKPFVEAVYTLGDRIKYHDPIYKDSTDDTTTLTWLNNLAEIVGKCETGETNETDASNSQMKMESHNSAQSQEVHEIKQPQQQQQQQQPQQQQQQQQQQWSSVPSEYTEGPTSMMEVPSADMQSDWQPMSLPANMPDTYDQNSQYMRSADDPRLYQLPQQQEYWNHDQYYQNNYGSNDTTPSNWQQQSSRAQYPTTQADTDNIQQHENWNYEPSQPAISMTPSTRKQYDPLEELDALETPKQSQKPTTGNKKASEKSQEKKPANSGGSWFGGLFSKLAPKPKNQMILPDDNNPTIVWDPVGKKWMNKDEDGEGSSTTLAPPPKASDMGFRAPSVEQICPPSQPVQSTSQSEEPVPTSAPKSMSGNNMFKLPKGRSMRANYIDVMNPNGTKGNAVSSTMPTPVTSPLVPIATSSPQLFVPPPVNDPSAPMDFLTPTSTPMTNSANVSDNASQGLSRWSSTSSLSREVQSYTMRDPRLLLRNKGPMMYNPNDMKDRSAKNTQQGRYAPR